MKKLIVSLLVFIVVIMALLSVYKANAQEQQFAIQTTGTAQEIDYRVEITNNIPTFYWRTDVPNTRAVFLKYASYGNRAHTIIEYTAENTGQHIFTLPPPYDYLSVHNAQDVYYVSLWQGTTLQGMYGPYQVRFLQTLPLVVK